MAKLNSVMPLLSSEAYLQTHHNLSISSDSVLVNIYRTSLIINPAHTTKEFGGFTIPIYSILKMYLKHDPTFSGIIDFITNQKTISDFFKYFINDIEEMALLYRQKVLQLEYTAHHSHKYNLNQVKKFIIL